MRKPNSPWNEDISQEEIYNREFTIGYLLQTNSHIPLIKQLKEDVLAIYVVKAKFTYLGYNGHELWCNNRKLIEAKSKFDQSITLGTDVKLIEGNLHVCGSNKYPAIASKQGQYCILEFISYGLPFVNKLNGWSIELVSLNKF